MATVRELITRIAFKVEEGRLKAAGVAVGTIKKQMRSTARETRRLTRNINGMALGLKAAAGAFIASRALKIITTDFSVGADRAAKFAKATGISVEMYQALGHAVQLSGGEISDLDKGLQQLGKRALEVSQGNKTLRKQFDQLGVSVTDSAGKLKNQDELLFDVADRFKAMEDGSKKTGLAMQLLGRSGAKLIPFFNEGSAGIRKMTAEAKRLGIVLTKDQAAIAEQFNDELLRSKAVLIGVRNQIAVKLLPVLTRNLKAFKEWATEGDNLARALDTVKKAAIAATVAFVALKATKLGIAFAAALPALKAAAVLLMGVARSAAAAAAPLLVPLAIIAALALAIEDLVRFARGEGSVIGDLFGDTAEGQEVKDLLLEIGKVFMGMRDSFREVNVEFLKLFKGIIKAFGKIVKALLPILLRVTIVLLRVVLWLTKALAWAVDGLVKAFNWLVDALAPVGDAFTWIGEKAAEAAGAIAAAFTWAADKVTEAWDGTIGWLGELWDGIVSTAKTVGKAIASPFVWAAGKVKGAWNAAIGWIKRLVDSIANKIQKVSDAISRVTGGKAGSISASIAQSTKGLSKDAGGKTENNLRTGPITVQVQGTANMTPEQLEVAASKAMRGALNDFASDLVGNRRPLVEGAPG
jgi:hypothetical protein